MSAFLSVFRDPDLRKKILFTITMIILYRIGSQIPTPGVDYSSISDRLHDLNQDQSSVYSMINLFSGGALLQLSIFAIGIMPYITASIIVQLLTVVIPKFEQLKKEGQSGQAKMTQYTRYLAIALAVLQGTSIVAMAASGNLLQGCTLNIIQDQSIFTLVVIVLVMTAGAALVMWMGELVTERGIGNGMSLMIFAGIAARIPSEGQSILESRGGVVFASVVVATLIIIVGVVFVEQGQRRIPVQYAKRMVGRRMFGGSTTYIPLKVNQSGVIPVIFASSILYLPVLYATFRPQTSAAKWIGHYFTRGDHPVYNIAYFLLIIFFCYFYVAITFDPVEMSDNMKKYGGFIPGIRAGKPTEDYLAYVLSRLTAPGSLYLGLISMIPTLAFVSLHANQNFPFGGTSILIIVGVALDTVKQVESKLQQRHYEGFLSS